MHEWMDGMILICLIYDLKRLKRLGVYWGPIKLPYTTLVEKMFIYSVYLSIKLSLYDVYLQIQAAYMYIFQPM